MTLQEVWNTDAPKGKAWLCPDCDSWATLGGNAGFHVNQTGHRLPVLGEQPSPSSPAPQQQAGDFETYWLSSPDTGLASHKSTAKKAWDAALATLRDTIGKLETELERERMCHAACGVISMSNTPESLARNREMHADYLSASVQDCIRAAEREIELRDTIRQKDADAAVMRDALEQLTFGAPSPCRKTNGKLHKKGICGMCDSITALATDSGKEYAARMERLENALLTANLTFEQIIATGVEGKARVFARFGMVGTGNTLSTPATHEGN